MKPFLVAVGAVVIAAVAPDAVEQVQGVDWNPVVEKVAESIPIIVTAFFVWLNLKKTDKAVEKIDTVSKKLDEIPVDERMTALTASIAKVVTDSLARGNVEGRAELKAEQTAADLKAKTESATVTPTVAPPTQ